MDIHLGNPGIISYFDSANPLGQRVYGGHLAGIGGTGFNHFRTYGMYAMVLLLGETKGRFRDNRGTDRRLSAGDLIFVFPEVPHQYGPEKGDHWEEVFVAFDGPAFDAWRSHGLNVALPVWRLDPLAEWSERFFRVLKPTVRPVDASHRVAEIHGMIADALASRPHDDSTPAWLEQACHALARGAGAADIRDIATQVGLDYDSFRKAFKAATGEPPQKYRSRMRVARAALTLQRTDLKIDAIATSLGYYDAFHFSKAFRAHHGCSPSDYRRRAGATPGHSPSSA
ncbi:AraC family transcriptional regulator [Luteolibacter flavescens]|uniref:AraC family transcriptional regulator n=1 Tax=Luteolibacter flavescens TaxID=1859460 RepID=A0ABT3FPG2_9BACT|nr:AraC family transcriptional regulator [Luteolibacter flavescens]MCW1884875.1 AraC family transcriptional regulator [Luteolibacter flavescens]